MSQTYLRFEPSTNKLILPIQAAFDEKSSKKMWGENNYKCLEVPDDCNIGCLLEDLDADGNVQPDPVKLDEIAAQEAEVEKGKLRALYFGMVGDSIGDETPYDQLTSIQKKIIRNKMPTDQEFIDAGYTFDE